MQVPEDEALGSQIRRDATRHAPPPALAVRIADGVREAAAVPADGAAPSRRRSHTPWRWLQSVALFGAGAAVSWGLALSLLATPQAALMSEAVTSSHVRSLMGAHLVDVGSSDHHTVKPWFAGKLDFSPPVIDLAAQGFPLTGGRLDYLDGRPVAALIYGAGPHIVNLFVWPAAGAKTATPPQASTHRGYNLVHWVEGGMQAWAVSDLNPAELQVFASRVRDQQLAAAPSPR
ncbi:anti-sigma factor [Variovorax sp. J22R133]|uniref:anti-sigma factor family protein n=1 Tax=Variovorax brevis TaxID=3053503 RepID=UPI0025780E13|nr:anti-sigma factor [Variovorax sp. J22R133]MDM0112852.1 anti-sigma factor [Variovorax sp. J22R133]